MKLTDAEERIRLARIAEQRWIHDLKRQLKISERAAAAAQMRRRFAKRIRGDDFHYPQNRIPLELPENFSLRDNFEESMASINELRQLIFVARMPVIISFRKMLKIDAAAALVLCAEVYRCRNLVRMRLEESVIGNYPRDPGVFDLLSGMGFFDLLSVKDPLSDLTSFQQIVSFLKFQTSNKVSSELIANFKNTVLDKFTNIQPRHRRRVQGAMIEAIGNSHEHAYRIRPQWSPMNSRWWLGGSVNFQEQEVNFLLFDQGAGIPKTLNRQSLDFIKALATTGGLPSDGFLLAEATKLGRTGTLQPGRGKGFKTMKQLVDLLTDGELWVLSNRGEYLYKGSIEGFSDHFQSLDGTLISWRLKAAPKSGSSTGKQLQLSF